MTTVAKPTGRALEAAAAAVRPLGGLGFDWAMMLVSLVFVGGLYLDGWAHNHGKVDQSFFTVWHAFFYAGYLLVALLLGGTLLLNRLRGLGWQAAAPAGYHLAVLGVLVFAAGGVGDLLWHELFGIEQDFDALFSPTHLALVLGMGLIVSGPLRAAWQRTGVRPTWRQLGPALLSLAALVSLLSFITMYASPLVTHAGGRQHFDNYNEVGRIAGALGILVTALLLAGPPLLALARWQLPVGSLPLVWGSNLLAMTLVRWHHSYTIWIAAGMLGAGLLLEGLRLWLRPGPENVGGLRLFAFLMPVLLFGGYFALLALLEGIAWSIHLWTGIILLAGAELWLLTYLLYPPALPVEPNTSDPFGQP